LVNVATIHRNEKCDLFIYLLIYQAQREHKTNISRSRISRSSDLNQDQNLIGGQMAVQNWTEINAWTALIQRNLWLNQVHIHIWPRFKVEQNWCKAPLLTLQNWQTCKKNTQTHCV